MDMKSPRSKVKVAVRVRPSLESPVETCVNPLPLKNTIQIFNHRNVKENLQYEFSSVFDSASTQQDIFSDCVQPHLKHAFEGQNVSIFAYGPTGAGKTHTMLGLAADPGIIPRVIKHLFQTIQADKKIASPSPKSECPQTTVKFSYLEIYNEKVHDLLAADRSDLPIREDAKHNIFVAGLKEVPIDSLETFKQHFGPACSNRTVAATKLNEHSSRSHSILMLKVHRKVQGKQYIGKIYLIDLAGSEDNRRTGNKGIRLKESGAINKSLFVLGEVVDAINNNSARIPYRNSKLTRLLQDSIGGNCYSVMLTNIAPEKRFYHDTYCTLNFASKSKKIVNVTTTTCIDESVPKAPAKVTKPTVALKPNKSDESGSSSNNKARSPVEILPSPLVRRQNQWEVAANQRIEEMEKELKRFQDLEKMRQMSHSSLEQDSLNGTFVISNSHLPSSPSRNSESSDSSPGLIPPTPDCFKRSKGLRDMTNMLFAGVNRMGKPPLKRVLDAGPSCSPLFPDSPPPAKRKRAKKSSASKDVAGTSSSTSTKIKQVSEQCPNQSERCRKSTFLETLNTANVKELQQLQTVGVKRAKLIFEWREMNGTFDDIDCLLEVPTFTQNTLDKLLKTNYVYV